MITIDETHEMLDKIACELPVEFYRELNGGILLLPQEKISPAAVADDLYILGEYVYSTSMGRLIYIYYGSFAHMFGHLDRDAFEERLRETLYHEFTHHMESLAGERGLEKKDELQLREYKKRHIRQVRKK